MPRLFISYRRDDTPGESGRLADQLRARFGEDRVFIDVDSIHAGDDFARVIDAELATCSIMLVLIGRHWAQSVNAMGRRRLEDPHDFVRLELETALRRNVRLVPVLVRGAVLPKPEDLPATLQPLLRRQAIVLADTHFRSDVERLIASLEHRRFNTRWAGAALAALAVFVLGAVLPNHTPLGTARVVVRVHGPGGMAEIARGPGWVKLNGPGQASRSRPLVDGEATFDDLPPDTFGRLVDVSVGETAGFQAKTERHIVPADGTVIIELARVETTSKVSGTVLDAQGQPLAGAMITFDNNLVSANTDQYGAFRIEVPCPPDTIVTVMVKFKDRVGYRENLTVPGTFTLKWDP